MKRKTYRKAVVFLMIFVLLLSLLGTVVEPKWIDSNTDWEPATRIVQGFYDEPKDSLDVIYLGSSLVYRGISPIAMWNDYGFTGYDLGSSVQRMWISYYYLEEALKTQDPKAVVLNMNSITDDSVNDEDRNRKALDYMKLSPTKLQAIPASISDSESFLSYLFPLLRFHSRWDSLEQTDFTVPITDHHFFAKGQDMQFDSYAYQPKADWLAPTDAVAKPGDKALDYFNRIVALCRNRGIPLLLIDMISPARFSYDVHNLNQSLADQNHLSYLDFNFLANDIGLNWSQDMRDEGVHLNVSGAEKFSRYLGGYLASNYNLNGKKDSETASVWRADALEYAQTKADFALTQETDISSYLKDLNNPNFLTVLSVKGYVSSPLDGKAASGLKALGLKTDFSGKKNWSYLAVLNGGKVVTEESANQPLHFQGTVGGVAVDVSSSGYDVGNSVSIQIGQTESAKNLPGFNIVVYDTKTQTVADSVSFNLEQSQSASR